jgi:hypothetical protein
VDEDDKVRRNLVVFSAAIILLLWLEVPLQPLLEKHLHLPQVSALRAWLAALVVLCYLALRYRFSEKGARVRQDVLRSVQGAMYSAIGARLHAQVKKSFVADVPVPSALDLYGVRSTSGTLKKVEGETLAAAFGRLRRVGYELVSINVTVASYMRLDGSIEVLFTNSEQQVTVLMAFKMQPKERVLITLPAGPKLAYSDAAVNLLLPYAVAVVALAVILRSILDSLA